MAGICTLADRPHGRSRGGVGAISRAMERKRARDGIACRAKNGAEVRCWVCQHVQTVPVSQQAFSCEQCNADLKRATLRIDE
jgi:hypothetical protein